MIKCKVLFGGVDGVGGSVIAYKTITLPFKPFVGLRLMLGLNGDKNFCFVVENDFASDDDDFGRAYWDVDNECVHVSTEDIQLDEHSDKMSILDFCKFLVKNGCEVDSYELSEDDEAKFDDFIKDFINLVG